MIEFILATAGLTYIVTQSRIFNSIREYFRENPDDSSFPEGFIYELLSCPLCFGFWAGLFVYIVQGKEIGNMASPMFLYAFIGSITSYMIFLVISFLKKL